jgi:hypothetical protein
MAWTNKKGLNLRDTLAYVSDPGGTIAIYGNQGGNTPLYSSSSWTLDSDTFKAGATSAVDGMRNRNAGVDARLAGQYFNNSNTFQLQLGTAPGNYKIWIGFTNQNGTGYAAQTITVADANGTLFTLGILVQTGSQVADANNTVYATAAAWAATADTSGTSQTITSTDTSNGNGGPLITISSSVNSAMALSHLAVQYIPATGATLAWIT